MSQGDPNLDLRKYREYTDLTLRNGPFMGEGDLLSPADFGYHYEKEPIFPQGGDVVIEADPSPAPVQEHREHVEDRVTNKVRYCLCGAAICDVYTPDKSRVCRLTRGHEGDHENGGQRWPHSPDLQRMVILWDKPSFRDSLISRGFREDL